MRFLKASVVIIGASLMALMIAVSARAQAESRGVVRGTVEDRSGALVANAKVSIVNGQQLSFGQTESDPAGRFNFAGVPPGVYEVRAARAGFGDRRVPRAWRRAAKQMCRSCWKSTRSPRR